MIPNRLIPTVLCAVATIFSQGVPVDAGLELLPVGEMPAEGTQEIPQQPAQAPPTEEIGFRIPLTIGGDAVEGKTLEQLITGMPLFSPIKGLPPEVWKDKKCTACHAWTPQALCTQGGTYLKEKTALAVNKEHPYGGGLKINLKFWALQGCE